MKAYVFPGQGAQFVGMGKTFTITIPLQKSCLRKQTISLVSASQT